jgi:hypothetical protein
LDDIGVVPSELFNDGTIRRANDQWRPVRRIGKHAAQEQVAAALCLSREPKMFLAKLGPTRHIVLNHVIEKGVVTDGVGSNWFRTAYSAVPADLNGFLDSWYASDRAMSSTWCSEVFNVLIDRAGKVHDAV